MTIYPPIVFIIVIVYVALVKGTHEKFRQNKLQIKISKALIFPAVIFFLHLKALMRYAKTRNKKMIKVILKRMLNYPLFLGEFIEVLLEKEAHNLSLQHKSKTISNKNLKRAKKQSRFIDMNMDLIRSIAKERKMINNQQTILH
ncbi:hypothetical protein AAGV27_14360 [Bacillus velezensis]|uniref:hypothetical protein n=1 Tax=Bacillus velezensis TaxID=492670 RepID=UPI0023E24C6F|nr:hypothetical protein [Bacillus velezensis]WES02351.1 hypothetical protein PX690_01525 [Bacillus velezensis]